MEKIALLVTLAFLLPSFPAFSEDAERGRLPDGRAFRTDAQGNQLVDYIAELEVNIEQLNRRVIGLEDEAAEKQRRLERYQSLYGAVDGVVERDLVGAGQVSALEASGRIPAVEPRFLPLDDSERNGGYASKGAVCPPADCAMEVKKVSNELVSVKQQLELERESHGRALDSMEKNSKNGSAEALRDYDERLSHLQNIQGKELVAYREKIADLEARLQNKTAAYEALQTNFEKTADDMKAAQLKLNAADDELQKQKNAGNVVMASNSVAASRKAVYREEEADSAREISDRRASFSAAKGHAVSAVKEGAIGDIQEVRALIRKRDQLYNQYKLKKQVVQFKPAQPMSSGMRSVDSLSHMVGTATSVSRLHSLQREVGEIKKRIADDIALMNRMARIG